MLAALRMRGITARYVSGYLAPHEGEESGEASHAWVQLLAHDRWYGFDPANNASQSERYVVTAVGRDYDDVPPIRGTFAGIATEDWHTVLRVRSGGAQQ
jgi:transglutaminase-like putative cysteine protease